jgi:hypothetical protein
MKRLIFFVLILGLTAALKASTATVTVGQTATISVTANGTLPFTYQWYKDGVAVAGATSASLVLSPVSTTSAGTYTARVTNSAGNTTSDNGVLTVTTPIVAPSNAIITIVVSG